MSGVFLNSLPREIIATSSLESFKNLLLRSRQDAGDFFFEREGVFYASLLF